MCGTCVYNSLFMQRKELRCKCPEPEWVGFNHVNVQAIGTFCAHCGLLHYTSLSDYTYVCEGCDQYYSPDFRQYLPPKPFNSRALIQLPKSPYLCRRCDVRVPDGANRRRGFRLN
jgi:hypothetical protein